jgi:hypothetical protein
MTMARSIETYTTAALEALNNGFSSKAGQQSALADVNRAYELAHKELQNAVLSVAERHEADGSMKPVYHAVYWGIPSYPHQFKAKHAEAVRVAFGRAYDDTLQTIADLVELRATIKDAPVNAPVRAEPSPYAVRAQEAIADLMARRREQYARALYLGEVFGGLPVSANSHWVINEHGTRFIRTFYYLAGRLTPLNLIIAAAEELERRAEAA